MQRYTVEVISPCKNYGEPGRPLLWHFSVEAISEIEALRVVRNSRCCRGLRARVVPPLGIE